MLLRKLDYKEREREGALDNNSFSSWLFLINKITRQLDSFVLWEKSRIQQSRKLEVFMKHQQGCSALYGAITMHLWQPSRSL